MPQKGCISFDSYIKPQRCVNHVLIDFVVYLLFPTSNHNYEADAYRKINVVYLLFPTSNHNPQRCGKRGSRLYIFCFLHQTTTLSVLEVSALWLYIFCFLHQTTTCGDLQAARAGCISFVSYIKPQLRCRSLGSHRVVYLLFPTSNHNSAVDRLVRTALYIFCFLHQTTTLDHALGDVFGCISFVSYIKPQQ